MAGFRDSPATTRIATILLIVAVSDSAAPESAAPQQVDDRYLNLLEWRSIGPTRGGRVLGVAGHPTDDLVFYQGSAGGGIWKTEDGGANWRNVSDGFFGTGSVGAVEVSRSSPEVVYVGMGETCVRGNASHGDGVYRSDDGGATWRHLGLAETLQIARVRVHPRNPDVAWVAALGDAWGPSEARGVYRTRDGGATWEKVLYRDENTGAIDLVLDPANPDILYASLLELRRFPWGFRSAGPGTGLFKSTDGGDTWTELTDNPGLPSGLKGRIGITVSPRNSGRLWAIIDAARGVKGIFRSDDAGETWTRVNEDANLLQRPWYYHHIVADPGDENTVFVLNVFLWKSTDGGETFSRVFTPHPDHHDLWIDPDDPRRMINGSDGGGTVSFDGGLSWSSLLNQATAQLYHVVADNQTPYRLYASQQDNTSISVPGRSDFGRISLEDWYTVGGGEDGYIAVNIEDPNIVYAGDHHWVYRYDHRNRQVRDISPNPETHYGWGSADINYRFWWTYPVMTSPHDPNVLYVTSQHVHRTRDEGHSWEVISPDLTRADPRTLEPTPSYEGEETGEYWGPITREAYGPEWYATIFAFAESPVQPGLLWTGSDDGFIHVSRDGGANWEDVTIPDLPEFALISVLEPSAHDPATAYVAATRYKLSDHAPYLYRTTDYGETWSRITTGIPDNDFTRVVREDPVRPGLLYAGTERGVYVSFDAGESWRSLSLNLPVVPIHDLVLRDGDLAAATHGRSFWVLDNVALLHQLTPGEAATGPRLFRPRAAIRYNTGASPAALFSAMGRPGAGDPAGANPPDGVVIPYHLPEPVPSGVTLRILQDGALIREFSSEAATAGPDADFFGRSGGSGGLSAEAGAHTFVWDLRVEPAMVLDDAVFQGSANGPRVPPGDYTVELNLGGRTLAQPFPVVRDPRVDVTDVELRTQFEFLLEARDRLTETMELVGRIRDMRAQAEQAVERAGGGDRLQAALADLNGELYPVEERLVQYRARAGQDLIANPTAIDSKLARLMGFASMGDGPPTQGQLDLLARLAAGIEERTAAVDEIERTTWANLVRLVP
ncbi:WD40/YVTN/BNR-like repeat-containing protein [Candidatus Palauibacter sp.]|uniref:WD40/YVTN/BNR-like repeat-containing protein n=1 Tax=Candidatus Palauibacter sp. TaxID=3101350 RepID=UPI003AF21874